MATEYSLTVVGQPYFGSDREREVQVLYTEPEEGVNPDTGMLLLISGFEGDTSANVYKKMRMEFSDRENLVVVECDYFGYQFMGSGTMQEVHELMGDMARGLGEMQRRGEPLPEDSLTENFQLEESGDDFCELGLFQALDNLRALKAVMEMLACRGCEYNANRIIAYGYSHGAYLALLCNALRPHLFSGILDNSGWVYPVYLYRSRICSGVWSDHSTGQSRKLYVFVEYQGRRWIDDLEAYNLRRLYSQFRNCARILSFHGEDDGLVPLREKAKFGDGVENLRLCVIRKEDVDEKIFYNTQHGMGSDFLRLFYFVTSIDRMVREEPLDQEGRERMWESREFFSRKYRYLLSEDLELTRTAR